MKNKKILIALDYSPTAQRVADVGYAAAKAMNAKVTLLHVISDPVYYSSLEYSPVMGFLGFDLSTLQLTAEDLKKASVKFLDKAKIHLHDKNIETLVTEGDFADSILSTAKAIDADFIVLGTHSRRWLENILIGSVAEKVLHHSTIPLFIVPTKHRTN